MAALLLALIAAAATPARASGNRAARAVGVISGYHWGYRDPQGRFVLSPHLPPGFDWGFSEGYAPVKVGKKHGYINQARQLAIEPRFDEAGRFSEGLAAVKLDGLVGFVDARGNMAIKHLYQEAGFFSQGLAPAELGGKWGYIDHRGRFVIKPRFEAAREFSEDRAPVLLEGKWGYVDPDGRLVIAARFDRGGRFSGGRARVRSGAERYYIDPNGGRLADVFKSVPKSDKPGETKVVRADGKPMPSRLDFSRSFSQGFAAVRVGDRYGYIDKTGSLAIAPEYEEAGDFGSNMAPVRIADKWGFISLDRQLVIDPQFDAVWGFSEGL
ncbi:MAG TPA: WG repeat-containing protein, partial [Elusimicrobiota bacterium]|nr:WG repeat-containing protein [Elusimicrobiota bacterium]